MEEAEKPDIGPEPPEQKKAVREPSQAAPAWKWVIRLGVIFAISIFAAQVIFKYYSDEIFGKLLQEIVERRSNGLYQLRYEKVSFNLISQTLDIKGLSLEANRSFYDSASGRWNSKNNVFEAYIPSATIEGIDLRHIYATRSLELERFVLRQPSVHAYLHQKSADEQKASIKLGDKQINPFARLHGLLIRTMVIEKASFHLFINNSDGTQQLIFQDISAEADNFKMDSAATGKNNKPFTVDDIHVIAGYNSIELPNTPYTLQFNKAEFSTYAAMFDIYDFRLVCHASGKEDVIKGRKRSALECSVPQLSGRGVDLKGLYFNKRLFMQQLKAVNAEVELFRNKGSQGLAPISIYPKMSKIFSAVEVSKMVLVNTNVGMNWMPIDKKQNRYTIKGISGEIERLLIDSSTHQERVNFFYINHAALNIDDYSLPLPDHAHLVHAQDVQLSTKSRSLEVNFLEVKRLITPMRRIKSDSTKSFGSLSLQMSYLKAKQIDLKRAYTDRIFDMDYLLLQSPKASMFRYSADSLLPANAPDSLIRITDLYPYVQSFAKRIRLGLLDLRDGNIAMRHQWKDQTNALNIDSVGLRIEHWYIGPSKIEDHVHTLFNAQQVAMEWKGLHFIRPDSLYALNIGYCKASQIDSVIRLENISLEPQLPNFSHIPIHERPKQAIGLKVATLLLDSIDLQKAYYNGHVAMQELLIQHPVLTLHRLSSTKQPQIKEIALEDKLQKFLSRNFESLHINQISLTHGQVQSNPSQDPLNVRLKHIDVHANQFEMNAATLADPSILFLFDTLGVNADSLYWPMPDTTHALWAKHLLISTQKKKVQIDGIVIDTIQSISTQQHLYHIALPRLLAESIDLKALYYYRILDVGWLKLYQPAISIDRSLKRSSANAKAPNLDSLYFLAVAPLQEVKIQQFDTRHLKLSFKDLDKDLQWHNSLWDIYMHDFQLDSFTTMLPSRFLYADNISVRCRDFSHYTPDSTYHITANQLRFSTKTNTFNGLGIRVKPLRSPDSLTVIDATFPHINFTGWDLSQWHSTGVINAKRLYLYKPWVTAHMAYTPITEKKAFRWQDLPLHLQSLTPSLQLRSVGLRQAALGVFTRPSPDSTAYYEMQRIDMNIRGMQVDTSLVARQKMLFSDTLDFKTSDYRFNLPDSLHYFTADTIGFNTAYSHAYMVNPHFSPIDSMEGYAAKLRHEEDWIALDANRLDLKGWNIRRWLDYGDFSASLIGIDSLDAQIYRDKRLPDVVGHYPDLPRQALQKLPFAFSVDSIALKRSNLSYWEYADKGDKPGFLEVNQLDALIQHISNEPTLVNHWERATINLKMQLMHTGQLNAVFELPLDNDEGDYYYEGILDSMDLTKLNPMLEPTAFLKIRSGYAKRIKFKVLGNNDYATGMMRFYYKNLKVGVINPDKNNDATLISFIANTFVVNKNNPHHLFFMRKGKMFFPRDKEKSLVHYWSNTLLSGVKTSIGLNNKSKPDKAIRKTVFDAIIERFKLDGRNERKAERQRKTRLKEALKLQRKANKKE